MNTGNDTTTEGADALIDQKRNVISDVFNNEVIDVGDKQYIKCSFTKCSFKNVQKTAMFFLCYFEECELPMSFHENLKSDASFR